VTLQKIVIQVGDSVNLDATIDKLEKIGAVDSKNAKTFQTNNKATQSAIDETSTKLGGFQKVLNNIGPVLAGAFAVQNIVSFGQKILETTAKFQKFEAVLTNTLGSKSEAQKALKAIADFAATTPFQVDEITDSFIKLANRGVKLTKSEMTSIGDVAASLGKDFGQVVEAIADVNNTERWNEIGIKATTVGNKVSLAFKGTTIEVDKTVAGVTSAIEQLGKLQGVAGTTAAISKTLTGQLSNLSDSFDQLLLSIGNRLQGAFSIGIETISDGITAIKEVILGTADQSTILSKVLDFLKMTVGNLLAPLKELFSILSNTFENILKPIGNFLSAIFIPIIESFQKAFGGAGSSLGEFIAKFNPLIISLKLALLPLELLAKGLQMLTPIITDFIVPAFQDFTIFLAKARNEVADFINAIIDSGFAKKVTSTFGFEIAKIGKVNIDELKKSFTETAKEVETSTEKIEGNVKAVKKLTEFEKALAEEREKIRKKELEDRVKSQLAFEKMQKDGPASNISIDAIDPNKVEKDAKNINEIRKKAMAERNKNYAEGIKNEIAETEKAKEKELKNIAEIKQARSMYVQEAFNVAGMLTDAIEAGEQRRTDAQIAAINDQADADIKAIDDKLKRGKISEEGAAKQKENIQKRAAQQEALLKTKQAKDNKKFALLNIALDTAQSIIKGIAMFGPPPSPAGIAAIATASITGAVQAAIVAATPIPKFKDGVIGLNGPGTETSDSILARLSKGESVMTAKETRDYRSELEAMRKGTYEKYRMPITRRKSLSEARHESMSENIYNSLLNNNAFDDQRMVAAIKDTKRTSRDDAKLAVMITKGISDRLSENRIME
jgi:hypothetical protein